MDFPGQYSLAKRWLVEWSGGDDLALHLLAGVVLFTALRLLFGSPRWLAFGSTVIAAALNEVVDALHVVLRAQAISDDIMATVLGASLALAVSFFMPSRSHRRGKQQRRVLAHARNPRTASSRASARARAPFLGSLPA